MQGHFIQAEVLAALPRCKKTDLRIEEVAPGVASQKDFSVVELMDWGPTSQGERILLSS